LETFKVPVLTDIHTNEDADMAAQYVDVLQIPALVHIWPSRGCNGRWSI
jgi:3-deoxy-D-manno-octulosonic acid (KDO) 8-phosphate synthase